MKYIFSIIIIIFWTALLFGQIKTTKEDCKIQFDSISNREVYSYVDSMPEFPGGIDSLKTFIGNNLMWPNTEIDFEGTVYISVIVEIDGSLTNKNVLRGIERSADEEAIKVIDKMPKWKVGKCKGKNVPVRFIIPVRFKLY